MSLFHLDVRHWPVERLEREYLQRVRVGEAFGLTAQGERELLLLTAQLRWHEHQRRLEQALRPPAPGRPRGATWAA